MAETYTSKYANGEAVDAALDKAESALQAADVVNALDSTSTTAPLSAAQGKVLNDSKLAATGGAIAAGTVTNPAPILELSQTWNDAADTFTAIKADVTDTASASGSLLLDLRVGAASKVSVKKDGTLNSKFLHVQSDAGNFLDLFAYNSGFSGIALSNSLIITQYRIEYSGKIIFEQPYGGTHQRYRCYAAYTSATSYHCLTTTTAKQTLSNVSGATVTAPALIPAGANLLGVTTRINTTLGTSNGTTGYAVGTATDPNLWGDVTEVAAGTASKAQAIAGQSTGYTADDALGFSVAAQDVVITAAGGNFNGTGDIEVCVFYAIAEAD